MSPAGSAPSLATDVRKSVLWSSVNSVVLRLGSFAVGIAAARLVAPNQFGVFAVALTVHAVIVNISDMGVSSYLVRDPGDPDRLAPTVVTIALVTSAVLAAVMVVTAPTLAVALGSSTATSSIRVLSITLLLAGLSSVPNALLVRSFRQDRRFFAEGANLVVSSAVLVILAVGGAGALALAWSRVAGLGVSTALLVLLSPRRYWPGFDRALLRPLLRFSLPLAGFSFLGFATVNIDYVVVGRLLGAEQLGFYLLAYNISGWPFGILSPVVTNVAMPAFARLQGDGERLPHFLSNTMSAVCAIAFPISALLMALSGPLIHVVYGSRWSAASAALVAIALYGAIRIPVDLCINVGVALGRTRGLLACQIAYLVVLLPATIIGVRTAGIVGAGLAHIIGMACALLPGVVLVLRRAAGLRWRDLARSVAAPAAGAAAAGAGAHLVAQWAGVNWLGLLAGLTAGGVIYLALLGSWLARTYQVSRDLWSSTANMLPDSPPTEITLLTNGSVMDPTSQSDSSLLDAATMVGGSK